jgi:hypothetical protein
MTKSPFIGVLLITTWAQDGSIVARFRGYRRLNGPVQDLGLARGEDAIIARVSSWLTAIDQSDSDDPA